jgi:hypothetical protein
MYEAELNAAKNTKLVPNPAYGGTPATENKFKLMFIANKGI